MWCVACVVCVLEVVGGDTGQTQLKVPLTLNTVERMKFGLLALFFQ
jgi:hypothetical protein